ncbi:MAG: rhomboid family intramembrane serine protease [Jatrophihabitantaceae bacterium]
MSAPTSEHCYRHPNRETLVRCTRCERPICPDCMREAPVGFHCPDDAGLARKTARPQRTSLGARLRDSPPYVTGSLVTLNVIVYLVTGLQSVHGIDQPAATPSGGGLFDAWQLQPAAVYANDQFYRLLTSAFLHLSLLHIGANMLALVIVGPPLERLLGRWRLLTVYLLGALGGSAAVYAFGSPGVPVVGASGAIFGLFAACLVLVRRLGLDLQWLVGIIVLNFVFTFSVQGISRLGHIGGFVTGALAALALAGLPRVQHRIRTSTQAVGLSGVAVLVVVVVVLRTATGGGAL